MKSNLCSRRRFLLLSTLGPALAARPRRAWAEGGPLPKTRAVLLDGMRTGLHIGAQIHVSRDGAPVADFGVGEAKPGVPMTEHTLMTWYSSTKPLTSICVGLCAERGWLRLDDPVAKHVPDFAKHGKDKVTIRHVLTHTSGFPRADLEVRFRRPWDEVVAAICDAKLEEGWEVGVHAQYHPTSGMHILGEVVARVSGMSFDRFIRTQLFEPLDMKDCWVGMPAEAFRAYGDRMGTMMNTDGETPVPAEHYAEIGEQGWATICVPGGNGHGPMRELARFYAMMMGGGEWNGVRVATAATVDEFTRIHRPAAPNYNGKEGSMAPPWGLGISRQPGIGGAYGSDKAFGHGGSLSSLAFCDPEKRVVAAFVFNGRPRSADHAARVRATTAAIYQDLGLA